LCWYFKWCWFVNAGWSSSFTIQVGQQIFPVWSPYNRNVFCLQSIIRTLVVRANKIVVSLLTCQLHYGIYLQQLGAQIQDVWEWHSLVRVINIQRCDTPLGLHPYQICKQRWRYFKTENIY
jgi:hypothetical protein